LAYSAPDHIPEPLVQAAAIDGARTWQVFRDYQLPAFCSVLSCGGCCGLWDSFHDLPEAFPINAGGPARKACFASIWRGKSRAF